MRKTIITLLCSAALVACAGINVKKMSPDLSAERFTPSAQTLRIAPIANTPKGKQSPAAIPGKKMRETLALAFQKANLFREIVTEGDASLELRVTLLQQMFVSGRAIGNWELRRELIAEYELVEVSTGKTLWRDNIRTVAGSKAWGGNKAITESSEGAVRENIRALLQAASQHWPRGN